MAVDPGARGERFYHLSGTCDGQPRRDCFADSDGPPGGGYAAGAVGAGGRRAGHSRARGAGPGHRVAALSALMLGLAGLVVSVTGMVIQLLPRHFTAAQQRQIEAWEVGRRWQQMPAGQIFPASISYQLSAAVLEDAAPLDLTALRLSIAPKASDCARAVTSAAAGAVLYRNGCQGVLRATYVDATRSYVMTIGVAVLPSEAAAVTADSGLSPARLAAARDAASGSELEPGVQVVRFGGISAGLYDYSRQISASFTAGPYLVMYAVGYSDNRPRVPVVEDHYSDAEMTGLAAGVAHSVAAGLAAEPAPPHCPGAPGC